MPCNKRWKEMSLVMRNPDFCMCENKEADQRLCFRTWIVQSLRYLIPKFQASSHLLWLYSPVCVRHGRKPRRPVFSQRGSHYSSVSTCAICFITCDMSVLLHEKIGTHYHYHHRIHFTVRFPLPEGGLV